jgi:transposase
MKELYDLMVSVKGVGLILASNLLVVTNCFRGFENSRKFACYAGLAPFEKQSGTSLKKKSRVSHYANKKIKVLLNLSAGSAIQSDPELKAYYQRRIANGKSKMSTLNIVRNKIVHRIFAVVTRRTPYVPLYQHAA